MSQVEAQPGVSEGPMSESKLLVFGNVELSNVKDDAEARNVAEMVVARGFATVIR